MSAICAVYRRELGAYVNTPIGYVVVIAFLLLAQYIYVAMSLFVSGLAEMREFFHPWIPFLFLIFVPALAMRLWAEERQVGTLELLMTFPVRTWQAVLAKFSAGLTFLALMMVLTFPLPLALYFLSSQPGPDWGPIIGGYLGSLVLGMIYLSIGAFASSLTRDQIIAFVIGVALGGVFFLIGYPPVVTFIRDFSPNLAVALQRFGVIPHFESISRGVVDTRDLIYAVTVSGFFLLLNILVIERRR
jgi:ABC-2 type transport system permease protein